MGSILRRRVADDLWYEGRVERVAASGAVMVVFTGYEDDGPQETMPADVVPTRKGSGVFVEDEESLRTMRTQSMRNPNFCC